MSRHDREERFVALIGDIRGSRDRQDRGRLQERFEEILDTVEGRFHSEDERERIGAPVSGPTITTGDEFQALFKSVAGVESLIVEVTDGMHPERLRFGLGFGALETPVNEEAAIGMDGPCFHRARAAIQEAKEDHAWVRIKGFGRRFDPSLNAVFDLIEVARADWTDRQREFAVAYRELGVQQKVADRFEVSKSTVSESLKGSHAHEIRRAEEAIANLLAEAVRLNGADTE